MRVSFELPPVRIIWHLLALSTPNGTVTAYNTSKSGLLNLIDSQPTVVGPVSTVVYNDGKALVAAH